MQVSGEEIIGVVLLNGYDCSSSLFQFKRIELCVQISLNVIYKPLLIQSDITYFSREIDYCPLGLAVLHSCHVV